MDVPKRLKIDLQIDQTLVAHESSPQHIVTPELLAHVVSAAQDTLADAKLTREICLRICSEDESQTLNRTYRGIDRPTNVLSFVSEVPEAMLPEGESLPLGDLAVCWPVLVDESRQQGKMLDDHFKHLFLHGVLHLLGYDHVEEAEAQEMEALEIEVLAALGVANPYA